MRNEIHAELTNYLMTILDELCIEKNQERNAIDESIRYQSQIGSVKKCFACQLSNIDNKKRVCPTCNNKLPTIERVS